MIGCLDEGVWIYRPGSIVGILELVVILFALNPHSIAPDDYTAETRTVTFLPGQTTVVVPVPTISDATVEAVEQFTATLSDPSEGVQLGDSEATVSITEDARKSTCFQPFK